MIFMVNNKQTNNLSIRGKVLEGKVVRMKSKKTAHIEITRTKYIPKYERYLMEKSKFAAHVPDGLEISVGDDVVCGETRKISKTKSMVVIKKQDKKN